MASLMDRKTEEGVDTVSDREVGIVEHLCGDPDYLAVGLGSVRRDPHDDLLWCIHDFYHILSQAI